MAVSATDIISVEDLKVELRIPVDVNDHNDMLSAHISAAVAQVSATTGLPIIRRSETVEVDRPADPGEPVTIPLRHVQSVTSVNYWLPNGSGPRQAPGGSIRANTLGRLVKGRYASDLWPPASGWPSGFPDTPLSITVNVEFVPKTTQVRALRQAAILAARSYYDGDRRHQKDMGYLSLTAPHRELV